MEDECQCWLVGVAKLDTGWRNQAGPEQPTRQGGQEGIPTPQLQAVSAFPAVFVFWLLQGFRILDPGHLSCFSDTTSRGHTLLLLG